MSVLEPLRLVPERKSEITEKENSRPARCLICPWTYEAGGDLNGFLKHLLEAHRLVIADVNLITDTNKYFDYWRKRLTDGHLEDFCPVIRAHSKAEGETKDYYLLCDTLPEDKQLRIDLQQERLKKILEHYEAERNDENFNRECLFCRSKFRARNDLLDHMSNNHNFSIGHPDNLVFLEEFLDVLADKLAKLNCFFCEKTFKDRLVLKEHMRKKLHKRLNPRNKTYDKYYLVNYLEFGKSWEEIESEPDEEEEFEVRDDEGVDEEQKVACEDRLLGKEEDWNDWTGSNVSQDIFCLICRESKASLEDVFEHMKTTHGGFNFQEFCKGLDFYEKVKVVNYFRRVIHMNSCPGGCEIVFESKEELMKHLEEDGHWQNPKKELWNRPEYFFPTYEDDNLLCSLEDEGEDGPEANTLPEK